ncbi:MAG TPA: class I SAM-dependent methyltransferase [Alphaproteobacteria bacterium]
MNKGTGVAIRDFSNGQAFNLDGPWAGIWQALRRPLPAAIFSSPKAGAAGDLATRNEQAKRLLDAGLLLSLGARNELAVTPGLLANLRSVSAADLKRYVTNTAFCRRHGNARFSEFIRNPEGQDAGIDLTLPSDGVILYHSYLPGMVHLGAQDATAFSAAVASGGAISLPETKWTKAWVENAQLDFESLVHKSGYLFIAIQNTRELNAFLRFIATRALSTVVEIGTARGGTFYCLSQLASDDALLVSMDLMGMVNGGGQSPEERPVFESFRKRGQTLRFIEGNSHEPATKDALTSTLGGRKVDLLFIDGDHSYAGVKSDFEMYRDLVKPGGLVVFHDICLFQDEWGDVGVGDFWREARDGFQHHEFIDPQGSSKRQKTPGEIPAWGIGVLEMPS